MKSNLDIAKEVIHGEWGNGSERKERLTSAGYNYNDVQSIVNALLKDGYTPNEEIDPIILGTETLVVNVNLSKYNSIKLVFEV